MLMYSRGDVGISAALVHLMLQKNKIMSILWYNNNQAFLFQASSLEMKHTRAEKQTQNKKVIKEKMEGQ
jgi:hypothetical protein